MTLHTKCRWMNPKSIEICTPNRKISETKNIYFKIIFYDSNTLEVTRELRETLHTGVKERPREIILKKIDLGMHH